MVSVAQADFKLLGKLEVQAILLISAPEEMGEQQAPLNLMENFWTITLKPGVA